MAVVGLKAAETLHRRIVEVFLAYPDDEMYERVLGIVCEVVESPVALFAYLDDEGVAIAHIMMPDADTERRIAGKMFRFPLDIWGDGLWSRALRTKKPIYENTPRQVPEGHVPIRRALVVPIVDHGAVIGHFELANKPTDYNDQDAARLEGIAAYVAPVLRARLERDVQEKKRRQAEQELDNLSKFPLENPSPVLRIAADGIISYANRASAPLLAAWQRSVGETVPDDWRAWIAGALAAGESREVEVSAGGRDFSCLLAPVGAGGYVNVYAHDITERKRAEAALRASESDYRTLVENLPQRIFLKDLRSIYVSCNANYARDYHITTEQIRGKTDYDLHPKELADKYTADDRRIMAQGVTEELDERCVGSGEERIVHTVKTPVRDPQGQVAGILGIFWDITDRHRAAEALRASEQRYRTLAAVAPVGLFHTDAAGRSLYVNERWSEMTGLPREQARADGWVTALHPEDRDSVSAAWSRAVREDLPFRMEYRFQRPDGRVVWVLGQALAERDREDRVTGYVGTITDITPRKQAEAELQRLNEELERRVRERTGQLEAANKDLEAFSYTVSHDLRAPLRHMSGFAELLEKQSAAALDETGQRYLRIVAEAAQRMGQLIDDLLAFSRAGRADLQKTVIRLDQLVQEAQAELQSETAGRQIEWQIDALPEVHADRSMLRLVFVSLLSNALKFTRPRPRAKIEVRDVSKGDDELVILVRDNGVGFDMQYLHRLFNVFQRLHRADEFEGTGVGLASVRRIVQRHGGRTWAEGTVDGGACFYFALPIGKPDRV